jgi:hypothetical protein
MTQRYKTRERDEEILWQLQLRTEGLSLNQIVRRTGGRKGSNGQVGTVTLRVREADIAEAAFWGDTPEQAAEGYW